MSRLITFGCSYTYGEGFSDCGRLTESQQESGESRLPPSKFAWPSLLADRLNIPVDNQSFPGISNSAILDRILTYNFNKDDIICILWTHKVRGTVYINNTTTHRGVWDEEWVRHIEPRDIEVKSTIAMHHAYCYLKLNALRFYMMDAESMDRKKLHHDPLTFHLKVPIVDVNFTSYARLLPKCPDGHPGPKLHNNITEILYKKITEDNNSE
jgi:hypothetical protein